MKKLALFMIILLIAAAGCRKKYQCMHPYYNRGLMIGFTGFQQADLHPIVVQTYKANGRFDTMLATNTYTGTGFYYTHDTAKASFMPGMGNDYIISVPATGNTFHLSHISYTDNSTGISYTSESPCNSLSYVRPPDSITINGTRYATASDYRDAVSCDIYLAR